MLFAIGVIVCNVSIYAVEGQTIPSQPEFVENEILVKYKKNQSPVALQTLGDSNRQLQESVAFNGQMGVIDQQVIELTYSGVDMLLYKTNGEKSVSQLVAAYKARPEVEYAEPNFIYYSMKTPNDPRYGSLWGMAKIKAPVAWDETTGTKSVLVADIDTGIDENHEDLKANLVESKSFTSCAPSGDQNGHGTHTAGTIGAVGNNSKGVVGVNWQVGILAFKVGCTGRDMSTTNISRAINEAAQRNAKVINMSLGGSGASSTMQQAITNAVNSGTVVVASAGNDGPGTADGLFPGAFPNVISVAATTSSDGRASFSSTGNTVDVAAPGLGILSTWKGGSYNTISGTSMAAPHVTGLVGLMFSKNPNMTPTEVKSIIEQTADDLGRSGKDTEFGYGRINAQKALERVSGGGGTPPTPTGPGVPTVTSAPRTTPPVNVSPTPSPGTRCEEQMQKGDYNCDGKVDQTDFNKWKQDFLDGISQLFFFEFWRRVMFR